MHYDDGMSYSEPPAADDGMMAGIHDSFAPPDGFTHGSPVWHDEAVPRFGSEGYRGNGVYEDAGGHLHHGNPWGPDGGFDLISM